ncbi:MAG: hypothetical protein ACO394_00520 [Blastocatellia bacterium]
MPRPPRPATQEDPDAVPTVLVMPGEATPAASGPRGRSWKALAREVWRVLLHDLSYLLPLYAVVLGGLLIRGRAPAAGIGLLLVGLYLLGLRVYSSFEAQRTRRRIAPFRHWARIRAGSGSVGDSTRKRT